MINGEVTEHDITILKEVGSILERRANFYGDTLVRSFLGNSDKGWKNGITTFYILQKDVPPALPQDMKYRNALYAERIIPTGQLLEILRDMVSQGILAVADLPKATIEGSFSTTYHPQIESSDKIFSLEWSSAFFPFESTNRGAGLPSEPLVSMEAPLYPHYMYLIQDKFGISSDYYQQFLGGVLVFLPNYKARITGLRLGPKTLMLSTLNATKEKLVAKGFLSTQTEIAKPEVPITEPQTPIPLSFQPDFVNLYLISSDTGETIDSRYFHLSWPTISRDVVIEVGNEDILQIISQGEGEQTEFKQEITKSRERFIESVVAFANTFGGRIFIGIGDHGEIIGSFDQKLEETIQNIVRSNCEPPVELSVETRPLADKNIVVVNVIEGNNKPYTYRGKGVYVRSGSTNRIATRDELDDFYRSDTSDMFSRNIGRKGVPNRRSSRVSQDWI